MTDTGTEVGRWTGFLDVRTGELLDATIPHAARVLHSARAMKKQLDEIVREATDYLAHESALRGTKTLHDGGETVTLTGGPSIEYDPHDLVEALEAAGCPRDRIDQAVVATVTYKVDRSVLRQLAGANPDYKAAIELAQRAVDKDYRATVKLRRQADEQ